MNKINYTHLGGLPVTQEHLDFLQQSFSKPLAGIAALLGNKVIVSGVTITGANATDGWVVINSELLPFIGGSVGASVVIVENVTPTLFLDGGNRDVYYSRYATFGTPAIAAFADFKRLSSIQDITTAVFKPGMITMWSGAINQIPAGFALCDGSGGTPNLQGSFIVGYSASASDYNLIGKTGGETHHILSNSELPELRITQGNSFTGSGGSGVVGRGDANQNQIYIKAGSAVPHENRPPYYVLAYIIKL